MCGTTAAAFARTIEKPASSAACVATAEKLELNRLSSFSRSSIVRCFTVDLSSSLSAASMLTGGWGAAAEGFFFFCTQPTARARRARAMGPPGPPRRARNGCARRVRR